MVTHWDRTQGPCGSILYSVICWQGREDPCDLESAGPCLEPPSQPSNQSEWGAGRTLIRMYTICACMYQRVSRLYAGMVTTHPSVCTTRPHLWYCDSRFLDQEQLHVANKLHLTTRSWLWKIASEGAKQLPVTTRHSLWYVVVWLTFLRRQKKATGLLGTGNHG